MGHLVHEVFLFQFEDDGRVNLFENDAPVNPTPSLYDTGMIYDDDGLRHREVIKKILCQAQFWFLISKKSYQACYAIKGCSCTVLSLLSALALISAQ